MSLGHKKFISILMSLEHKKLLLIETPLKHKHFISIETSPEHRPLLLCRVLAVLHPQGAAKGGQGWIDDGIVTLFVITCNQFLDA